MHTSFVGLIRGTGLTLSAVVLALTASGRSALLPPLRAAHAQTPPGGVHSTTDSPVYAVGDTLHLCYQVPSAGTVTVTDLTPDRAKAVLFSSPDGGSGDCRDATITPPTGKECLQVDFTADDPTSAVPEGTDTTCFQTLPQGAIAEYFFGGTIAGLDETLVVYDDGHATDRNPSDRYNVTVQIAPKDMATILDYVDRFTSFTSGGSSPSNITDGVSTHLYFRGRGTAAASESDRGALNQLLNPYVYQGRQSGRR
jgi:hypothetical protein